jgi:hypothetical protein
VCPRTPLSAPFERALAPSSREPEPGTLYKLFVYAPFVRPYRRLPEKTRARVLGLAIFAVLDPLIVIGPVLLLATWLRVPPLALRVNRGSQRIAVSAAETRAAKYSLIVGAVLLTAWYLLFNLAGRQTDDFVREDVLVVVKATLAMWMPKRRQVP